MSQTRHRNSTQQSSAAAAGFYKGRIAHAIVAALQGRGSVMELEDLAAHRSTFTRPISTTYRGHRVYEIPPPTQVSPAPPPA